MIPLMNIIAWGNAVPWGEQRQVEQDLIISRIIVELFRDQFLNEKLRFRGGTALNKLYFPKPVRYSEDIDLVRTTHGPIGPILRRIRELLEPWLGHASFSRSRIAPSLLFRVEAEDASLATPLRLKIEINTREVEAYDGSRYIRYGVDNPWFNAETEVHAYSQEEILATKLRALLQRDKGRDMFDLAHSLVVFEKLDTAHVIECFLFYMKKSGISISRSEAEQRMLAKVDSSRLLNDVRPLLPESEIEYLTDSTAKAIFLDVFNNFIGRIPGKPWAKTEEKLERLGFVSE